MKELIADIKSKLESDGNLDYIKKAGGFVTIAGMEQFPLQFNTPCVAIVDDGTPSVRHLSSRAVWRELRPVIHVIQRIFERHKIIDGSPFYKSVEQISEDVRLSLNLHRFNGKYVRAFFQNEDPAVPFIEDRNMHIVEKALTFQYVRIDFC